MSLWKIGADDVSQETQSFKDKLASKEGQIAAQQAQLNKKAQELEELQASLNEALQKLVQRDNFVLCLQEDLTQCKEDLRNERNSSRNIEASLSNANSKLKDKDREIRDLEASLERLSETSNDHNDRVKTLEHEKSILDSRVRELESQNRQLESTLAVNNRRAPTRSSSAQFNDLKIIALEKDTGLLREKLSEKEAESIGLRTKLSNAQDQVLRLENEAQAKETRIKAEVYEMQTLLQEKEEELKHYKSQQGGCDREEELLQRIDEDEARISALEATLAKSDDVRGWKEKLRNVERRLKAEVDKVTNLESRNADILQERDDVLTELDDMQDKLQKLKDDVQEKQEEIDSLRLERKSLMSAFHRSNEVQAPINETGAEPVQSINEADVNNVEKLLNTIERLRGERDNLRRDLQFLEMEFKFSTEAFEKRLAEVHIHNQPGTQYSSVSSVSQPPHECKHSMAHSVATDTTLPRHSQNGQEQCEQLLSESMECEGSPTNHAETEAERCSALQEEMDVMARRFKKLEEKVQDSECRQEVMIHDLEAITSERDDLISQLEARDTEEDMMKTRQKALQDKLEEVEMHLDQVSRSLEVVESERDSLALQVQNLSSDIEIANEELADSESRYSDLQFHQLSTMTSSEVTQTLRKQIAELEGRVMRRTEQVGIHQHDIHRLETNLRLSEERMAEMTMEIETLETEKETMLEDCADARDARDEALVRIEALEEDLETFEYKLGRSERALNSMICLLLQTRVHHQESRAHIAKLETEYRESQSVSKNIADDQASATHDLRQMAIAFAISQLQCNKITIWAQKSIVEKDRLLCNLALANERVKEQESLGRQLEGDTSRPSSSTIFSVSSSVQTESDAPGRVNSPVAPEDYTFSKQSLHSAVETQEAQQEQENAISDLVQETECLRKELSEVVATLEQERTDRAFSEGRHVDALGVAQRKADELESRVQDLSEEIVQLTSLQENLRMEKEMAQQEAVVLRGKFESSSAERVDDEASRRDLTVANERLSKEIHRLQEEREELVQCMKSQADAHLQQLNAQKAESQSQVDDLMRTAEDQTREIQILSQELDQEKQRFQESNDKHVSLMEDLETAHSNLSAAQGNISKLQKAIQLGEDALARNEKEKDDLRQDITSLETQMQKSLSYTDSLQRQIRDSEHALEKLKAKLKDTQGELSRAETTAKTTEINLNLQAAQFKRELSKLQNQLTGRHDLDEALTNLEERNNEMEELLRAKCAEIEENDDRALEMLKENKKLSTKVEALARRVQNLQTKLTAAKAAAADSRLAAQAAPVPAKTSSVPSKVAEIQTQPTRRSLHQPTNTTASSMPAEKTESASKPHVTRAPSSSASLRPKTPVGPTPVFKLRTPEQLQKQGQTEKPPASIVGVKRRAPDEFERKPQQRKRQHYSPCTENVQ
ncbi:hypothetical protein Agabi119p4_304 [Agaricus bisporus var. burnettii]|uniref:Uncharacterized protein n=1 Tax=Agaricus bisporus var. burnettii TaxID=192524 RepID=A0A8H7FAG0_AGABI|nr:hypothetical protein Agabi119p4_304 [Agaricus bisporus var. burnettii]